MKHISIKSRKNPRMKIIIILIKIKPVAPTPIDEKNVATSLSPPRALKTSPKAVAPMRIIKTILVSFVASIAPSLSDVNDNRLRIIARTRAPDAPTAAASVGDAIPIKIDPSTANIRAIGGNIALLNAARSGGSIVWNDGANRGFL